MKFEVKLKQDPGFWPFDKKLIRVLNSQQIYIIEKKEIKGQYTLRDIHSRVIYDYGYNDRWFQSNFNDKTYCLIDLKEEKKLYEKIKNKSNN